MCMHARPLTGILHSMYVCNTYILLCMYYYICIYATICVLLCVYARSSTHRHIAVHTCYMYCFIRAAICVCFFIYCICVFLFLCLCLHTDAARSMRPCAAMCVLLLPFVCPRTCAARSAHHRYIYCR
jgi:hypothetical protein